MIAADRPAARLSTRIVFFIAGFGLACWAPLVPLAKQRLQINDATLGLLLLCLGVGSIIAMIITGPLSGRYGTKPVIVVGSVGFAFLVPALALAPTPLALGGALLLFGAALGSVEVAANILAVEVERAVGRPIMSGFHGLFSIGGFAGSLMMTAALYVGIGAVAGTCIATILMLAATFIATPRLAKTGEPDHSALFVRPKGIVLLLAGLTAAVFLIEGAMLDWSALLIAGKGFAAPDQAGVGYIIFATAMAGGRLMGDRLTTRVGNRAILLGGGLLCVVGFAVLLPIPVAYLALTGFLLIGLGASNIVPVFFRLTGLQTVMPPALAVSAVATTGYAGILAGPAAIGFVANEIGLSSAFWMLAALMALVPLTAKILTKQ